MAAAGAAVVGMPLPFTNARAQAVARQRKAKAGGKGGDAEGACMGSCGGSMEYALAGLGDRIRVQMNLTRAHTALCNFYLLADSCKRIFHSIGQRSPCLVAHLPVLLSWVI